MYVDPNVILLQQLATFVGYPMSVNKVPAGVFAHLEGYVASGRLVGCSFSLKWDSEWSCRAADFPYEPLTNWISVENEFGFFTARARYSKAFMGGLKFHLAFQETTLAINGRLPFIEHHSRYDRVLARATSEQ